MGDVRSSGSPRLRGRAPQAIRGRAISLRIICSDDAGIAAVGLKLRIARSWGVAMQAHADAAPLAVERPGQPWARQRAARSAGGGCDAPELGRCEVGRDAHPTYHRGEVGTGSVVVAGLWLAFFVIAAIHSLGNWN
jgi:hypothetical protein